MLVISYQRVCFPGMQWERGGRPNADEGWRGGEGGSSKCWPMLTRGGGGVRQLLTIADEGGRGGLKTLEIGWRNMWTAPHRQNLCDADSGKTWTRKIRDKKLTTGIAKFKTTRNGTTPLCSSKVVQHCSDEGGRVSYDHFSWVGMVLRLSFLIFALENLSI